MKEHFRRTSKLYNFEGLEDDVRVRNASVILSSSDKNLSFSKRRNTLIDNRTGTISAYKSIVIQEIPAKPIGE